MASLAMRDPISSNATLHALTERLAKHSRALPPLGFPHGDKLSAYRSPAPPPQLPVLQISVRHQDSPESSDQGSSSCPAGNVYPASGKHSETRCGRCEEEELDAFVRDMGLVMRKEFDCWVEQCWTEAFHYIFIHELPTLLIHLILTGSTPTFLRRQIVHGGPDLDRLFQQQMTVLLMEGIEERLSGHRIPEDAPPLPNADPNSPILTPALPRDGVCFHSLATRHGLPSDDDDHGMCMCQLSTCLGCFHSAASSRKGPHSVLPHSLAENPLVADGFAGQMETDSQARVREQHDFEPKIYPHVNLPSSVPWVRRSIPKALKRPPRRPALFPHPQMTDVLAVEEHLRWRLKEMGAKDPAVETRYGPSTNDPAALEGVSLPDQEVSDDGSVKGANGDAKKANGKMVKVTKTKGKVRRVANGTMPKKKDAEKDKDGKTKTVCYLPKEWMDEEPTARNTALVLTFRHFVKLLHQIATTVTPFSYPSYANDIAALSRVHPVALYRRLAEPNVTRKKPSVQSRAWLDCMDKWTEELGAREKTQGNKYVTAIQHKKAIDFYTRAISLDPKKTVYYSNRAVALNALGQHELAESDCKHILSKDSKNGKAFFQRALARRGLGRWREAEADLKEVLRHQSGNESARKMIAMVRAEVAKLPKQTIEDVMDF